MKLLSIDPDSNGGWAYFVNGKLRDSGRIKDCCPSAWMGRVDAVVIENSCPGRGHNQVLDQRIGRFIRMAEEAGIEPVLVHPKTWKAHWGASKKRKESREVLNNVVPKSIGKTPKDFVPNGGRTPHAGTIDAIGLGLYYLVYTSGQKSNTAELCV